MLQSETTEPSDARPSSTTVPDDERRPIVPILRTLQRIPAGMLLVPMLIGALIQTFAPHTDTYFGSFTGGWLDGVHAILAVYYVCLGATIDVRAIGTVAKKGGVLFGGKLLGAVLVGIVGAHLLGASPVEGGVFAGLSTLALVSMLTDTNGSMYMALMQQFGTAEDAAAYSIMSLESGAFITMVILGVIGLGGFPWQAMAGAVIPLALGILLGNLDPSMRKFLRAAIPVVIPFQGLALGFTINLADVGKAGFLGIGLGFACFLVSAIILLVLDRLTGGNGIAGVAAGSTAGNAVVVPATVAAASSQYAAAAPAATVLVASAVVVTAVLTPIGTTLYAKWVAKRRPESVAGAPFANPTAVVPADAH